MKYLNEKHIKQLGIDWNQSIDVIRDAVYILGKAEYNQPIKPYLRYRNPMNRIIAMPAYIGGNFNMAGIKWIASFPENIEKGIPRASSVVILNQADTGVPLAIINTALLSIIRTASVSGLMISYFIQSRSIEHAALGISGFGPIGRHHLDISRSLLGDKLDRIYLYDIRGIDLSQYTEEEKEIIVVTDNWKDAYQFADIFITCTVSKAPYIDLPPKSGSLQLNVSLRDYKTDIFNYIKDAVIVDDWDEVCRQNTDIEKLHKEKNLQKGDVKSIVDVVLHDCMENYKKDQPIMFNPMGMAVFDMALGSYYFKKAAQYSVGVELE